MVTNERQFYDYVRGHLLWFKEPFNYTEQTTIELHLTSREALPYGKDIRRTV
jgi:hypothetical protein